LRYDLLDESSSNECRYNEGQESGRLDSRRRVGGNQEGYGFLKLDFAIEILHVR